MDTKELPITTHTASNRVKTFVLGAPLFSLLLYAGTVMDVWPAHWASVVFVAMNALLFLNVVTCFVALLDRLWLGALVNCIPIILLARYVFS